MTQPPKDSADWASLERLLAAGLMLPVEERPAWLAALPAEYDVLREPLRRLLEVQAGVPTRPVLDAFTSGLEGLTPPATAIVGDLVGPYRLLQQLGDGGMGSVWLAERSDGTLKRRVALKLPRMVWARDLSARMARERDILGSLEHPHIARLYDAGVDQLGRPFLALEYVEGERIDIYCDNKQLSVAERVRVFLQVLDAVHYAHVNLVLHRDLKPGNILVNQRGEVRLLDFGIAKLMSEDESFVPVDQNSRTLARAMTPRYASPEQVQHQRLSLASDVYSLGVMLYELLVGNTPLITQNGSRAEIEIAITEGRLRVPSRAKVGAEIATKRQLTPAKLSRALRGDLDAILLKALSRQATERYPSADTFRADLLRWLERRPVMAKPPSRLTIVRKFVARNTLSVSLGSAAAAAVIAAAVVAMFQAHQARMESARATATRDFLIGLFENANPELHGGKEQTARDLLLRGENKLETSFFRQADTAAEVALVIGNAWAQLGDYESQLRLLRMRTVLLSRGSDKQSYIKALLEEASVALRFGNFSEVQAILKKVRALSDLYDLPATAISDHRWIEGWISLQQDQFAAARDHFNAALKFSQTGKDRYRQLSAVNGLVYVAFRSGDALAAEQTYQDAMRALGEARVSPGETLRRSLELHWALFDAGAYRLGWENLDKLKNSSEQLFSGVFESQAELYILWMNWATRIDKPELVLQFIDTHESDPEISRIKSSKTHEVEWLLATARASLAAGQVERARRLIGTALGLEHADSYRLLIDLLRAEVEIKSRRPAEAVRLLKSATWAAVEGEQSIANDEWRMFLCWYRGTALDQLGYSDQAENELERALELAKKRFPSSHPIVARLVFAHQLSLAGRGAQAQSLYKPSKTLREAESVLERAYPEKAGILRAAKKMREEFERPLEERNARVLAELRETSSFL